VPDRGKVAGAGWIWSFTPAPAGVKDGLTSGGTRRGITASRPGNKSVLCSLQRLVSIVELRLAYLESALPPIEFLFELDALLPKVDFVSIGSNDLMQFLFAADRTNARVGSRYDSLTVAPVRVLNELVKACARHKTPLTLCGEMAGRPLEAMALIGLGFRTLSMAPASIGPVKTMILALHAGAVQQIVERFLREGKGSLRTELTRFAEEHGIEI